MKRILLITAVVFLSFTSSWAGTIGDVNGDGAVGLPEAIHALQVTAGIRTQGIEPPLDFRKYFYVENGDYEYKATSCNAMFPGTPTVFTSAYHIGSETVNGVPMLTRESQGSPGASVKDYYIVGSSNVSHAGYTSVSGGLTTSSWNNPAVIRGTSDMSKGDIIPNFLQTMDATNMSTVRYDESTVLGVEDVAVPAGIFTKCLKILRKVENINTTAGYNTVSIGVLYYAENIGMVKSVSPTSTMELQYAKIGSATYPQNAIRYAGTFGQTMDNVASGSGTFTFVSGTVGGKTGGTVTLYGSPVPTVSFYQVISTDGVIFAADPAVYGDNPPVINLVASASPCTISGSIVPNTLTTAYHGTPGEPTTPPVVTITISGSCS